MAAASHKLIGLAAERTGRLIAAYSHAVVTLPSTELVLEVPVPRAPSVWIGWHEGNLMTLALQRGVTGREAVAFVPPGLNGAGMRGWLEGLGITPIALAADARRGLGLRHMEAALAGGKDVLIAVDGPCGPRHRVAPGAIWLARAMGVEIRPVGVYASPALRLPRWDRLIVPLPGARMALAIGAALPLARGERATMRIAATLHALMARAQDAALPAHGLRAREMLPWR